MEMLILSFAGSMLAYFAFLSASSSAASAQAAAASNWPPTMAQQQALAQQIGQIVVEITGKPLSTIESQRLGVMLANAPAQYQATLPQGAQPTIAGYQAWMLSGTAATAATSVQPSAQAANPYMASSGGPLGLQGGNPNPRWDVHGNAWFTDSKGCPYVVFHSTYAPADYILPLSPEDFAQDDASHEE